MPPKSTTSKAQASLENWFSKPKAHSSANGHHAARPRAASTSTDPDHEHDADGVESHTLPPPSEPDSDDELLLVPKPKPSGKGKARKPLVVNDDDESEMEEDEEVADDIVLVSAKKKATSGKKKPLVLADEPITKAKSTKPRTSGGAAGTIKEKAKPKAKAPPKPRAKAKKAKPESDEDADLQEDEDDEGNQSEANDPHNKLKTHADDLDYPPLTTMPAIFKDMVSRKEERRQQLRDVAKLFHSHVDPSTGKPSKLRVGTMCSGTESPLLALQLIVEAMESDETMGGLKLDVEHIFSCEIEPFKQAYIERNFRPPILFRDVTELGGKEATTAYGALVPVPGNIDMLIAGTSCVDYSTLNTHQKSLTSGGESGNTFFGMLSYVQNHRPPIVILENVCSAPWKDVCQEFERIGYEALHVRLDTKNFYIPHTRTRGYLIAIEARRTGSRSAVKAMVENWEDGMKGKMPRPASCTLDAFLLPSDDPRIHEGRQRLAYETKTSAERRRKEVDWARCEQRHTRCRADENLGNKRPLTKWEEGGGFTFLDHIWEDWGGDAVPRVKDLMDVSHLRAAKIGVDASYKTTVWNLSQNVDRQIGSGRLGIAPCLTPTMIAYITNRGGPLIGIEALGLQGLPVDRLLLTRETQDQLADLAGNAMSTTVVGSAMIQALIQAIPVLRKALEERKAADSDMHVDAETIVERPLFTETLEDRISALDQLTTHPLELSATSDLPWSELVEGSTSARRWCRCEGRISVSDRQMMSCVDCGTTSCVKCGLRPEHNYEKVDFATPRPLPVNFAEEAKKALPMALRFSNVPELQQLETLRSQIENEVEKSLWNSWKDATRQAMLDQFSFVDLRRQEIWVGIYESPFARLELHLHPKQPEWRLYALPTSSLNANDPIRGMLTSPVARMRCEDAVLAGKWEYAVPSRSSVTLVIRGVGDGEEALTDSWEKSLGLLDKKFYEKQVWKQLEISVREGAGASTIFDRDLAGTYQYLPKCGTAANSLHKRVLDADGNPVDQSQPDLFFLLDPTRCREGSWDRFVFTTSTRRYEYEECRPIIAKIGTNWRQSDDREQTIEASVDWTWVPSESLTCQPAASNRATYAKLEGSLELSVGQDTCAKAIALLTCAVDIGDSPGSLWPVDQWFEIDKLREREYLRLMAWVLQRVRDVSHAAVWKEANLTVELRDNGCACERCAPTPPDIRWFKREKGNGTEIKAIEDARQAGPFERALKARPAPFQIHVKYSTADQMGRIVIGINPSTLIHQAVSHLPRREGVIEASWRLDTSYVPSPLLSRAEFIIPSNRNDPPAEQPEGFKLDLRPEQLRSLRWMQRQEDTAEPFVEEEVCEGTSEHLGWRLEGRARRPVMIRGGVLADQVGYGKTAIMLGLIATRNARKQAKKEDCPPGKILAKGTCVIVPAHLVLQWKSEVTKFVKKIGKDAPLVITLHQGNDINSTTIEDIQDADIIIVASSMPNSEHYWDNLGSFAGVPLPNKAGRYFNARLKEAHKALAKQVELLQTEEGVQEVHKVIEDAYENAAKREQFVQGKRLKGRAYAEANEDKSKKLIGLASNDEASDTSMAPPVVKAKPAKSEISTKAPNGKPKAINHTSGEKETLPGPSRDFIGVFPPQIDGANAAAWKKLHGDKANHKTGRRKSSVRKKIILDSDSDESGSRAKPSGGETEDDYVQDLSESESEVSELESSSEAEAIEISDDESDAPIRKKDKAKPKPKAVKRPAKVPKVTGKRKAMNSEDEQEKEGEADERPAKKPKPKKSRATTDPWKLRDKEVQEDWTQMRAPPLDMFHFHRLVIDEFTYTKKEHVSHAIVTQLSATCRWVMSGTPPTGDFASVKGIATFLGIHLGVDDDAEGTTEEVKSRIQDKTAAETFHSFRDVRSAYWHASRHSTAQSFINRFMRQNLAEIEDIPLVERINSVTLTASERALYLELDHYLRAQELKMKKTGKSQSDRVRRLNKALGDSKTPEEALLKCASHFDCQTTDILNSTVACDIIVEQREGEKEKCKRELRRKLIRAFKTERKLRGHRSGKDGAVRSHFRQTLDEWEHGGDKDRDTKEILAELVTEARDPDATIEPESSSEEDEPVVNARGKKAPSKAKAKGKKGKEKRKDDLDDLKDEDLEWAHREGAHELRALAKELGGRVRSSRFFQCVRAFQGDEGLLSTCGGCGRSGLPPSEISILSSCGHVGCRPCIEAATASEACVEQISGDCKVPASAVYVVPANSLGHDKKADAKGRHWGQKLEDIVALINSYPKDERVLLFVQFPDLTKKVAEALDAHKLAFSEIRGTPLQQSKVLQDFQDPKSKARILLLNLGDESASGGNLTVANHAIFISPLLSKNQFEYDQAETQAIGRIRRFGQIKTANIYRFVTRDSIDVAVYEKRSQSVGDLTKNVQIIRKIGQEGQPSSSESVGNAMEVDD